MRKPSLRLFLATLATAGAIITHSRLSGPPVQPEAARQLAAVTATPDPCGYGWPGSAYKYCAYNDRALMVATWERPDRYVWIEICAGPTRYGQRIEWDLVWTALKQYHLEVFARYGPAVEFTAQVPCRMFELAVVNKPADPPDHIGWLPDVRRRWRSYVAFAVGGE